jgi:hypothetical protein
MSQSSRAAAMAATMAERLADDAPGESPKPKRGRPKGARQPYNVQRVFLDESRYRALSRAAEDRGQSMHSLILQGIDAVTGRPVRSAWK